MLKILFFGQIRELTKCSDLVVTDEFKHVNELVEHLRGLSEKHELALSYGFLVAVNQEVAELTTSLKDGDEIAIFPPVTGG